MGFSEDVRFRCHLDCLWLTWAKTDEHRAQDLALCRFILLGMGEILNAVFICRHKEGSEVFFSEEKKQKTLANSGVGAA